MTEVDLYSRLRNGLSRFPDIHMCRIENGVISGMPDVEACWRGRSIFVELKISIKGRVHTPIRNSQIAWSARRIACGGRVMVLVGCEETMTLMNAKYITYLRDHSVDYVAKNYGVMYHAKILDWKTFRDIAFGFIDDKY